MDVTSDWRQKLYPKSDSLGKVYTHGHVAGTRIDFKHDQSNQHLQNKTVSDLDRTKMTLFRDSRRKSMRCFFLSLSSKKSLCRLYSTRFWRNGCTL